MLARQSMQPQPFTVQIAQPIVNDVADRLARTRWPDELPEAGWDYGVPLAYLQELTTYWRTRFDWRAQEREINLFAHYRTEIEGLGIHFIHERGNGPNPLPFILTHGWPGSFYEMHKIIPLLTGPARCGGDPADAVDVVVPSLPGYGFSDPYPRRGPWNTPALWAALMRELGYACYGAQGGDIGAGITTRLGQHYLDHVAGTHLSATSAAPNPLPDAATLTPAEQCYLQQVEQWKLEEGGYGHMHRTRPQTLAHGLNASPAGLAAWIVEKYRVWSDCRGEIERRFTKAELLTTVMLYWATATINSSIRPYYESQHTPAPAGEGRCVTVPTAITISTVVPEPPREWAERTYNVQRWSVRPSGGHFLALEEPAWLADDLRACFRGLR